MTENRGAWLVAGSAFLATLIALGGIFVLGDSAGRGSSTPRPMDQAASLPPEEAPGSAGPREPTPPASTASSPRRAVRRLLEAWIEDDRVAARRVAAQVAVERFFEEPLGYRPDFYLADCNRHQGDWSCSLGYEPDDRVGYILGIESLDQRYWVGFADLIVL